MRASRPASTPPFWSEYEIQSSDPPWIVQSSRAALGALAEQHAGSWREAAVLRRWHAAQATLGDDKDAIHGRTLQQVKNLRQRQAAAVASASTSSSSSSNSSDSSPRARAGSGSTAEVSKRHK